MEQQYSIGHYESNWINREIFHPVHGIHSFLDISTYIFYVHFTRVARNRHAISWTG